jgi:SAM-dependent methyltransferase
VVGGSEREPKLSLFREMSMSFDTTYFGISEVDIFLDLNDVRKFPIMYEGKFDMVICSQVLEHVFNVQGALSNLTRLLAPSGFIWINVPASNFKHGSPDYFSSGYQPQLISMLLAPLGVMEVAMGDVGSKRLYFMTHKQQFWPSFLEHKFPVLRGVHNRKWLFPLKFSRYLFRNIQAHFWSPRFLYGSQFSTETYFFGIKSPTALK